MEQIVKKLFRILSPLMLYIAAGIAAELVSEMMVSCFGMQPDVASLTVINAVIALPFLWMLWKRTGHEREKISGSGLMVRCIAAFVFGMVLSALSAVIGKWISLDEVFSNAVQEKLFASSFCVQLAGLGLLIPAVEELLFRGLMYERMKETMPQKAAWLCCAAVFAISHGNVIQMLYAFPMALIFQWFYIKTGNLSVPVLAHMGSNLFSVIIQYVFL